MDLELLAMHAARELAEGWVQSPEEAGGHDARGGEVPREQGRVEPQLNHGGRDPRVRAVSRFSETSHLLDLYRTLRYGTRYRWYRGRHANTGFSYDLSRHYHDWLYTRNAIFWDLV